MKKEAQETQKKTMLSKSKLQWLVLASVLLIFSLLSMLITIPCFSTHEFNLIGYKVSLDIIIKSLIAGTTIPCLFFLILLFIPFSKPHAPMSAKLILWSIVLFLCGAAAEVVLNTVFIFYLKLPALAMMPVATAIVLFYSYLCYELCFLNHFDDPSRFFEIFRFTLVGALAAIFDFGVTSLMRFVVLINLPPVWISVISVICGFIVGVIINYICSITMVFKKTTDKDISRTTKGIILFVILGAVGLGIGTGLEILFFDICQLPEPISFIFRTIIVMIWNYISRKLFIFK